MIFLIKKSVAKEILKSLGKNKLEELKQEVIEILKKQDEKEYKKALSQFENEEKNMSYLEKSISGEWIEKVGYGIGTVRVWKGKKYKKIAPGKWARMYEKEGRGTNIAVGHLIAKVKKIDDIEELMNFVMQNKQRFQDENGMDLPVLDKLRAAVDARNNGGMGSKTTSKPANYEKDNPYEMTETEKKGAMKNPKTKLLQLADVVRNTEEGTDEYYTALSVFQNAREEFIENQGMAEYKEIMPDYPKGKSKKSEEKKKTFKQEMNELYDAQDKAWEGFESGSEIKSTPENSKKFYDRVKKFVNENNIKLSKKHYDEIEDQNGHSFNEALALAGAYGEDAKKKELARNKEYSQKYKGQILDLSQIDEFKEKESEPVKKEEKTKKNNILKILNNKELIEDIDRRNRKLSSPGKETVSIKEQLRDISEKLDKTDNSELKAVFENFETDVSKYPSVGEFEDSLENKIRAFNLIYSRVNNEKSKKEDLPKKDNSKNIQNQMTPKQQKAFDDFEKKAIKNAGTTDRGKRFAKHNYNIDGEDWTITTDGRVMLCSREKFEEPTKTDKIFNMDKVFVIDGQKESAIPDGIDAIIKAAPKTVVTGKDYKGKEKKEFSIIKLGDRYFNTDYLKTVQNFLGPLSNVKMQVIPGDNKSRVKFESGNKAVVLLPIENGAELENRIINTNDIKKSLEDIIMFYNDFEDEDEVIEEINNVSLFSDYSAENPSEFNSIKYKVANAFEECGY